MGRFDIFDEQGLRRLLETGIKDRGTGVNADAETIIEYIDGEMIDDVRGELQRRYNNRQSGPDGEQIFPIAIPLAERYVAEQANAYNKNVRRYYTDENGEETEETKRQTDNLARMNGDARYDEAMHRNEQFTVASRSSCVWYQAKRGKLRPVVTPTHLITPVEPEDGVFVDHNDPDDFEGFVVELFGGKAKRGANNKQVRTFQFLSNAMGAIYEAEDPRKPSNIFNIHENPFTWEQVIELDREDEDVTDIVTKELPLRLLTFWHTKMPISGLIPKHESSIVDANREINVALSAIIDTIRIQGFSVPVLNVNDPLSEEVQHAFGALMPLALGPGETFNFAATATSYSDQIAALEFVVKLLAMSKRMSPNDFALSGAASVASGFAKMVDSLPKLEAREERIRWLTLIEEQEAAPRLNSIGITLGYLDPVVRKMRYRAEFPGVEFPMSEDEKTKSMDREIDKNLTTAAKVLAKRKGITVEEAESEIAENAEKNAAGRPAPQPQVGGFGGSPFQLGGAGRFGNRIRRTGREQEDET